MVGLKKGMFPESDRYRPAILSKEKEFSENSIMNDSLTHLLI